jgi:hypothetical protein
VFADLDYLFSEAVLLKRNPLLYLELLAVGGTYPRVLLNSTLLWVQRQSGGSMCFKSK